MMKSPLRLLVFLLAVSSGACGESATTTSPSTTTSASPATFTFASLIGPRRSAARTFTTSVAGTITVTLSSLGDPDKVIGLGVGVSAGTAPCSLATSVLTGPASTAQIAVSADAGSYCVQVWDPGVLTRETPFELTVVHP